MVIIHFKVFFSNMKSLASIATSSITVVPNFNDETIKDTAAMTSLKARLDGLKTLGLVRVSPEEYMVIYDGKYLFIRSRDSQN